MADQQPAQRPTSEPTQPGPSIAGLVWGLIFLAVAVVGLSGSVGWLTSGVLRWLVAGGVAAVGLILLLTALPRRPGADA
ncbi:hypothetical protein [Nakamurella aerolata]|uniref:Uncharacterized protein n=1 Tax=Nakamurella aerolata TaxID=1656892 RepID=A0A849ABR1_9ACTN|nr:hypothetical protein [Nakamurella aerolata]NNG35920.1 hypothetical protein [Nakamurella aerolata]